MSKFTFKSCQKDDLQKMFRRKKVDTNFQTVSWVEPGPDDREVVVVQCFTNFKVTSVSAGKDLLEMRQKVADTEQGSNYRVKKEIYFLFRLLLLITLIIFIIIISTLRYSYYKTNHSLRIKKFCLGIIFICPDNILLGHLVLSLSLASASSQPSP